MVQNYVQIPYFCFIAETYWDINILFKILALFRERLDLVGILIR